MSGSTIRWGAALVAIAALQAAGGAGAQDATFKCVQGDTVTYSQVPCAAGARALQERQPRVSMRYTTPPQDRAKAERRAELSDEARTECSALDSKLPAQEAQLKAMGDTATLQDEMPLVQSRKRFRELHC